MFTGVSEQCSPETSIRPHGVTSPNTVIFTKISVRIADYPLRFSQVPLEHHSYITEVGKIILSKINPTWGIVGLNLGLHIDRPASNQATTP
jgi:hypothetical protein